MNRYKYKVLTDTFLEDRFIEAMSFKDAFDALGKDKKSVIQLEDLGPIIHENNKKDKSVKIEDLKLHETLIIDRTDRSLYKEVMKVPGGLIYTMYDKSSNIMSSCFVPFGGYHERP